MQMEDDIKPLSAVKEKQSLELEIELPSNTSSQKNDIILMKKNTSMNGGNNSNTTDGNYDSTAGATYKTWKIIMYMLVFFFMMIGHEIALEAASTSESFQHFNSLASAVTLFQFGFCFLLPLLISTKEVMRTFPKSWKATLPYLHLSLLVFGATGIATQSLKYVSYPTKVVFKSAKLIPTMIVSTFITKSSKSKSTTRYSLLDYFGALLLCLGAAGYSYNSGTKGTNISSSSSSSSGGSSSSSSSSSGTIDISTDIGGSTGNNNDYTLDEYNMNTSMYGILLLSISIICDAIVPNLQQNLMTAHNQNHWLLLPLSSSSKLAKQSPKENQQHHHGLSAQAVMVNTNAVGFGCTLLYMFFSGSLTDAVTTAITHPKLLFYLICIGVGLSVSVLAYTKLIHVSGSVVAVAVSTLRKVVTVLLSYVLFPKPLLSIHVFSGILVLMGVLIGSFCRNK